jgi:hypothetical protein
LGHWSSDAAVDDEAAKALEHATDVRLTTGLRKHPRKALLWGLVNRIKLSRMPPRRSLTSLPVIAQRPEEIRPCL